MGICGYHAPGDNAVVEISAGTMNNVASADPKSNPKCGSPVKIYIPVSKETWTATIADVCSRCGCTDLALSPRSMLAIEKYRDWHTKIQDIDWGGPVVCD